MADRFISVDKFNSYLKKHIDEHNNCLNQEYKELTDGYYDGICACRAALLEFETADVQPVDRWISVKDRLPEEGVSVLICTNEGIRGVSARYGNRFFITIVEAFTEDTVTHWQPLPELPKDGNTE